MEIPTHLVHRLSIIREPGYRVLQCSDLGIFENQVFAKRLGKCSDKGHLVFPGDCSLQKRTVTNMLSISTLSFELMLTEAGL